MKRTALTIALLILLLNLSAQDKPTVKKLPVRITMIEGSINKETNKRNEELKEEYTLKYNEANQLTDAIYDYYSYGKNTLSANYKYNKQGNLSDEIYTREAGEKWHSTFEYNKHKDLEYVIGRTSYDDNKSIGNKETYFIDSATGLFAGDKSLEESNYNEFEYDNNNNLVKHFYNASTMAYEKTETYEYGTVYSPYVHINKLPIWHSSSLLLPRILISGSHTPVSYTEVIKHHYEEERNGTSKTIYTITADKDNYPVKIVESSDSGSSENYLYFKEYTFFYETLNGGK